MAVQGYRSQKKLVNILNGVSTKTDGSSYATLQPNYSDKVGMDVNAGGWYRTGAVKTASGTHATYPKRVIVCTSHGGSIGDMVRFEQSAANPGFEAQIIEVPYANTIVLGSETPNNIVSTNEFYILRSASLRMNDDGTLPIVSTSGPIQYVLNGVDTEVSQDTGTPANSTPLPVQYLNSAGVRTNLATETSMSAAVTALQIMDDWDESDRAKVNPIVGQAGVAGGTGVDAANVQRVSLATNVPLPAGTNIIGRLSADQSVDLSKINGATVSVNAGTADIGTIRVAPASNVNAPTNVVQLGGTAIDTGSGTSGAGTQRVILATNQATLPVSTASGPPSLVSTNNSSTSTLGIGAVFTGTSDLVQDYAAIEINVFTDQASAALGLSIQQSSNNVNWDIVDTYTVPASTGKTYSVAPVARYFRIVYTNGGVAQGAFRLQTVFHYQATRTSTHSIAESITNQNDAELVIAQLRANNSTNLVPMVADATGNLGTYTADITATGAITTQNLVPAGTATANSAVLSGDLNGCGAIGIQVTGTYTGALSLQGTVDNTTWVTISFYTFVNVNNGAVSTTITSAAQGIYQADCAGFRQVRVTGLAAMTGTATVTLRAINTPGFVGIDSPIPAGANIIGALTANQSINVAQIAGTTTSAGSGADGTGAQRITISNNATATLANVVSSATNVTLLASSATRRHATFFNDSTAILYIKFGATASATSYTVQVQPGGYYEIPQPCYSGIIDGIWASANGNCRVTSW